MSQAFTRRSVQAVGDIFDIVGTQVDKAHCLKEILAHQAIGVLAGAALPRVVRMYNVPLWTQAGTKEQMVCKLFALTKRQCQ